MLHESPKSDQKSVTSNLAPQIDAKAPGTPPGTTRRCAMCGKHYQVSNPKLLPFCSDRCQQVDLGNWLGEAYGMPWEDPAGGESFEREQPDE